MPGIAFFNQARSPLAVAVASTDLTIQLVSGGAWAAATGPFTVMIENEAIRCSGINGNTLTVAAGGRGFDQTSPQAHALTDSLGNPTLVVGAIVRRDIQDAFVRLDTAVEQAMTGPLAIPASLGGSLPVHGYGTLPVLVDDILVGTDARYPAATPQITFLNTSNVGTNLLPSTGRHFGIFCKARDTSANTGDSLITIRMNNDSGANYDSERTFTSAAATSSAEQIGGTQGNAAVATNGGLGNAALFASGHIWIPDYANTIAEKTWNGKHASKIGTASGNIHMYDIVGFWRSTAAITRLDLFPPSLNFAVGSRFQLWMYP